MTKTTKQVPAPRLRFPGFVGEWEEKKLGEVVYPVSQRNKKAEKLPIYSISNLSGFVPQSDQFDGVDSHERGYDISLYKIVNANTFAYNPARINVGSIGYSGNLENFLVSSLYVCFKTTHEIDDGFLWIFLKSDLFNKAVNDTAEGGIRSYLFFDKLAEIKTRIPPSLPEQTRIAAALSSLDAVIAAHQSKQDALREHKRGLMAGLFPAEGERVPRLRFPEFEGAGEWEEKKLGEVADMQAGKFIAANEIQEQHANDLFPCYGGNGIRGYVKHGNYKGIYSLIGRQGALCGNVQLAAGEFYATEHALVVHPKKEQDTMFLFHHLDYLELNQYATGQAQPGLSVDAQ